jgi:hypothetical protein
VFFLLFGSSCSGKTLALAELRGRLDRLAIHDFDEIGVPAGVGAAHDEGETVSEIARRLAVTRTRVYQLLGR